MSLTTSDSCSETALVNDQSSHGDTNDNDNIDIDYRIFCADTGVKAGNSVWGSYTNGMYLSKFLCAICLVESKVNHLLVIHSPLKFCLDCFLLFSFVLGAGLYSRSELIQIGRQFGEPGDAFHDRYVEANFAYRVGLGNCHAALRLTKDESCSAIYDVQCTGAFHHIGGGRGTRPRTAEGSKCMDFGWMFFGTPLYEKYQKFILQTTGERSQSCNRNELEELREQQFRDTDAESYREEVQKENEEVFRSEAEERQQIRDQASLILAMLDRGEGEDLRRIVPWMRNLSDDDIADRADHMEKLANSPHPLDGFWDLHGRVKKAH